MRYAVFDTKADSIYKDEIERRYHFPSRYLRIASQVVGSWVVYREPRADQGRMAYFAAANLDRIEADEERLGYYYAYVDNFVEFDREVPWRTTTEGYREQWLREIPQNQVGVQMRGKSIRILEEPDFLTIVIDGLRKTLSEFGANPSITLNDAETARRAKSALVEKKVRESSFRRNVIRAYDGACAFTGLCLVDLKGNPEVEAAHIRSVEHDGPDITTNGIALSRTAHWLFDRFLVSLSDELGLIFNASQLPSEIASLLEPQRHGILLPKNPNLSPALRFVRFHRQAFEALNS